MRPVLSILLCAAAILGTVMQNGCTPNIAGATTETTNGATGSLRNSDNTPAAGSIVHLFPADFDPVADAESREFFTDTTDDKGAFRFSRIAAGQYVLLARSSDNSALHLEIDIDITDTSITSLTAATLDKAGSVTARFIPAADVDSSSYVYVPGTDIFTFVEPDRTARFSAVPPGSFKSIILSTSDGVKRNIIESEVTVHPDDTVTIDHPFWRYSRAIILNTSSSGAGVNETVTRFPVLVRLDNSNFDFTETVPDGSDILFTRNGSVMLPFEIEQWDGAAGHAELWITVDTVFGNNDTQAIDMYWGSDSETIYPQNTPVFDTASGFAGVWHLGDDGAQIKDATPNRYDGSSPDSARPQRAQGIIGNCRTFDGVNDFITMPGTADGKLDFPESGTYTVSAWVRLDTADGVSHCIVSKGYEQYYLRSTYIEPSLSHEKPLWEFVEFSDSKKWQASNTPATVDEWTLVTGVRQDGRQMLYVNGVPVDSSVDTWTNAVSRIDTNDLFIGRFARPVTVPTPEGYCPFKGSIDELRILGTAKNAAWIRLCYMNQRPDDRLVELQ